MMAFRTFKPSYRNCGLAALGAFVCLVGGADEGVAADRKGGGGTYCKMRYDVRTTDVIVNDHFSLDNAPLGDVTMPKDCIGPVIGTFSAEIDANLHLHELWADCIGSGGFVGGCTPGQRITADPPHTLLRTDGVPDVTWPVVTVRWIWPKVPPGKWRLRVLPAAALGQVTVRYSTFTAEAIGQP